MLSILVPIYNFDVTEFVQELSNQCNQNKIEHEIICIDDHSSKKYLTKNEIVKNISKVYYQELDKNIGRSAIRNLLAHKAKYNLLLFVDCDSKIASNNYIQNYLKKKEHQVIYGGRLYGDKPKDNRYVLRWLYGIKRETTDAAIRSKKPFLSFMANNFLIHKNVFESIKMNEEISQYGHEDTLFGEELKATGINITHTNNPLYHIGLETNEEFLSKTVMGVNNLAKLLKQNKVSKSIKLIDFYYKISNLGLQYTIELLVFIMLPLIRFNLTSRLPSLYLFDIYKLYHLIRFMK